jgi:hypothetical protein
LGWRWPSLFTVGAIVFCGRETLVQGVDFPDLRIHFTIPMVQKQGQTVHSIDQLDGHVVPLPFQGFDIAQGLTHLVFDQIKALIGSVQGGG